MGSIILFPFRIMGWAAAGMALGAGWKLGSYLVEATVGKEGIEEFLKKMKEKCEEAGEEPLWKRRFSKISEDK